MGTQRQATPRKDESPVFQDLAEANTRLWLCPANRGTCTFGFRQADEFECLPQLRPIEMDPEIRLFTLRSG